MVDNPTAAALSNKFSKRERARLRRDWQKACDRLDADPEGAITAARTLLESTCKYVLEMVDESYPPKADLPELYGQVSKVLGISASGHVNRLHRQFFGSTHAIVQAVGELRNKAGDAHGKGQQIILPSRAQSELAVNLAGAVANFLLSSLEAHLTATRRLTTDGEPILKFDKGTVWRLVDHAENSPTHKKTWGQRRPSPSLWLVGDSGVYLMSNGDPPQLHNGRTIEDAKPGKVLLLTAHADGCGLLDEVDHWWPIHNSVAGGDDFCIPIPLKPIRRALDLAESQIVIVWRADTYAILADVEFDNFDGKLPLKNNVDSV